PVELQVRLAVELELPGERVLLVDADELDVPVLDRDRLDLGRGLERRQAGAVAEQGATELDVVDEQTALVDTAVADIPEREQDRLARVRGQVEAVRLEAGRRAVEAGP